ncbi:MAG: DegT/DnrJ/EryC1/StrS family aminotransferase [Gammaproteobacteria bacterium]
MNWKVPFFDLSLGSEEKQAVLSVLESNWLTSGPKIEEFESVFSQTIGGECEAVALSSATAALHLSLLSLGIGPGDEVILPSLTFVACANVVRYVGAQPVFADIVSETDWNISAEDAASKITGRTKAIIVVHYAGFSCDMNAFEDLCNMNGLFLIEDCSHSPLGKWKGRCLGTFGKTGCFSFFSNKNMTTGEGGMVVSGDHKLVSRLRMLRSHGMTASTYQRYKGHAFGYDVAELGYNYRLDEMRAAIGIEQLRRLSGFNDRRGERVERYRKLIKTRLPQVQIPFDGAENTEGSSFHIFPVLLPGDERVRDNALRAMADRGIQCSVHYRPIHTFTAYQGICADVPLTERIAKSLLTLPLFPDLTNLQMNWVVDALEESI